MRLLPVSESCCSQAVRWASRLRSRFFGAMFGPSFSCMMRKRTSLDKKALLAATNCKRLMSSEEVTTAAGREELKALAPDLFILAWWPYLLRSDLFGIAGEGCINFHPSLLPYDRGKHTTFWTLVEKSPSACRCISLTPESIRVRLLFNGRSPRRGRTRGRRSMTALRRQSWTSLPNTSRLLSVCPYHGASRAPRLERFIVPPQSDPASRIDLDQSYRARDLLDLLRAKTFAGYGGAWFEEAGQRFEVRVEIKAAPQPSAAGKATAKQSCPVCKVETPRKRDRTAERARTLKQAIRLSG